jgi:hypothetical protein
LGHDVSETMTYGLYSSDLLLAVKQGALSKLAY